MKNLFLLLISFLFLSCQNKTENKTFNQEEGFNDKVDSDNDTISLKSKAEITVSKATPFTKEFLALDDVQVNNNPLLISLNTFNEMYPKTDSVKIDVWECGNPLEWLDEKWMTQTYGKRSESVGTFQNYDGNITSMYINGATFISNKHVVLFDKANAKENTFIIKSANIRLDHNTTVKKFQELFPKLKKENTELKNVVRFRISSSKDMDDSFLFYFKDGSLDEFTLWWLLC